MIIQQEDEGPIEEFYLKKNMYRVFETLGELSQATNCDTEELKSFIKETQSLLDDYTKFIVNVEKKQNTKKVKQKFSDMTNQDFGD